jgi:hypothetical protein
MQVDELVTATPPSRVFSREFLVGEVGNFDRLRGLTGLCRGWAECRSFALDHAGDNGVLSAKCTDLPALPGPGDGIEGGPRRAVCRAGAGQ